MACIICAEQYTSSPSSVLFTLSGAKFPALHAAFVHACGCLLRVNAVMQKFVSNVQSVLLLCPWVPNDIDWHHKACLSASVGITRHCIPWSAIFALYSTACHLSWHMLSHTHLHTSVLCSQHHTPIVQVCAVAWQPCKVQAL